VAVVLRRVLTVPAAIAAAVLVAVVATPAPAARAATAGPQLQPLADEWWFSAWDVQTKVWPLSMGAGVTVAVLDSGVQASVADLRSAVLPGGDTTGAGTNGMTDDDYADDGHGTAMAALIAGQGLGTGLVGIAPEAKILPVRVGGENGVPQGGTPLTVAAGIRFAVNHGARVINLSLGQLAASPHSCDPVEQDAVGYALEHNVVVVAGAGNYAKAGNPPLEPASCAGVLVAGAVNPDLTLWPDSERQPYVDVTAPGNDVGWSGRNGQYFPDGYGTSQATAFTSGEAALIRSRYPSMPWQQVVSRIINTTAPKGAVVPNDSFGYGIIRLAEAVDASGYPVPASAPDPVSTAFRQWLASPQGTRFTSAASGRRGAHASASRSGAAASSGGSAAVPAVIAAAGVAAVAALALTVITVRIRRRGQARPGSTPRGGAR
jgi:membrane-anchored mycosin MYCP